MNYLILIMILVSIFIGSIAGGLFISIIYLLRRDKAIDSLIKPEDLIGMSAIVDIPFDANSKGKIKIKINNSVLYLAALTTEIERLDRGERVMILQVDHNNILVVKDSQDYVY